MISGTSADGIDAALVDIRGAKLRVEAFETIKYPKKVREAILAASNAPSISVREISRLNFQVGELFASAALKVCGRRKPALIGSHGQTIFHEGRASTLQIGEPAVIAARTGVTTVGDFRVADIAAGGEGAPLVPFLDYRLCRHRTRSRVALNIGGIANVTLIPAGAGPERVLAFDTGPGNMVLDALVMHFTKGKSKFDAGGAWAAQGSVNPSLLERLMRDPYFRRQPPKTAGREQYGREFVERLLREKLAPQDLIATVTALTVTSIAAGIGGFPVDDLLVSGGGVHNRVLIGSLIGHFPRARLFRAEDFGIPGDAKEAVLFALLAYETFHQRPGNIPAATGARRAVVLGKICYAR
jgi:anhydro-N-acetylmuramic acid kinase